MVFIILGPFCQLVINCCYLFSKATDAWIILLLKHPYSCWLLLSLQKQKQPWQKVPFFGFTTNTRCYRKRIGIIYNYRKILRCKTALSLIYLKKNVKKEKLFSVTNNFSQNNHKNLKEFLLLKKLIVVGVVVVVASTKTLRI